jgi:hypothetical protein
MSLPTLEQVMDAIKRRDTCLDSPGFCLYCGQESEGYEPDARNCECEYCGQPQVFGAEELLIMGKYVGY